MTFTTIILLSLVYIAFSRLTCMLLTNRRSPYNSIWEEMIDKPRQLIGTASKVASPTYLEHSTNSLLPFA